VVKHIFEKKRSKIKERETKMTCPIWSMDLELPTKPSKARKVIHKSFENPAAVVRLEEERLRVFRRVRDEKRLDSADI